MKTLAVCLASLVAALSSDCPRVCVPGPAPDRSTHSVAHLDAAKTPARRAETAETAQTPPAAPAKKSAPKERERRRTPPPHLFM